MKRTDITALFPDATDEQINSLMNLNGSDINKAKEGLTAAQAEIERLKAQPGADAQKLADVQKELDDLKAANALRELRDKVAKDTGVPAELLTQTDEAALKAQAEAIQAFAKPKGYPGVKDGGEVHGAGNTATRDKFAAWFNENMK